jgi:hypothetical protein
MIFLKPKPPVDYGFCVFCRQVFCFVAVDFASSWTVSAGRIFFGFDIYYFWPGPVVKGKTSILLNS